MYFKLEQTIREFCVKENTILEYKIKKAHLNTIKIYQPNKEDQAIGHKSENAHCSVFIEMGTSEKNANIFKMISENTILKSGCEPNMSYLGPAGERIKLPAYSKFPEHFIQYLSQIRNEMSESIKTILSIIRWRCGLLGPHQAISHRGFYWSVDNIFWHAAPDEIHCRIEVMDYNIRINQNIEADIQSMLLQNKEEPVHHELFREAWKLRNNNLRSSLLIGFTSLEVAVKNCISQIVPNSKWLVENLPSPPIEKILKEYFARLLINDAEKAVLPSSDIIDVIKKGIQIRNTIAHLGAKPPSHEKIEEYLKAIRECIWIMDYNSGNAWALGNRDMD